MARLFMTYRGLDQWVEQKKATLTGDQLVMQDGRTYLLIAAVHFTSVVGGEVDPHELLGKVKTETQLSAINAEHYKDSVLLGDVGYQVVEGFVGELV
jgi:hypothetical protein